jgi:predicted glutamine amidotransferase
MTEVSRHECDLFLLSRHQDYFADSALTRFAGRGSRNIHGWGIAGYHQGRAHVLRSADPATLLATLRLTDDEEWTLIKELPSKKAKMLVFLGPTLIFNVDIPR